MSRPREEHPLARARRAGAADRDQHVYERRRRTLDRQRAIRDRQAFDPSPPTQDDWVVPVDDTDGIRRIGPPTPVADSLSAYVQRRGWGERLRGANAWSRWDEIVAEAERTYKAAGESPDEADSAGGGRPE